MRVLLGLSSLGVGTEGALQLGNRDVDVLGQLFDALKIKKRMKSHVRKRQKKKKKERKKKERKKKKPEVLLHKTTASVVGNMPLDFLGSTTVQNQPSTTLFKKEATREREKRLGFRGERKREKK